MKIYLTLMMILVISFISSIPISQTIVLSDIEDNGKNILNYSLKWSEIDSESKEGCYILLEEGNDISEQIKSNWDVSYCENKKIMEIMFNTIQKQEVRIIELETKLNITYIEPKEDSLPLYYCAIENSTKECQFGISGGKQTRCYLSEILTIKTWDYCSSGWELN